MKNSKDQQTQSKTELQPLTDYHWQRNKAAGLEAEQMSKHPLSLRQVKKQIEDDKKVNSARRR